MKKEGGLSNSVQKIFFEESASDWIRGREEVRKNKSQGEVPVAEEVRVAEVEQVEELHVDQEEEGAGGEEIQCSKCKKKEKSKSDMIIHMDLVHGDHAALMTKTKKKGKKLKRCDSRYESHKDSEYRGGRHKHDEYKGGHHKHGEYRGGHNKHDEYRRGHQHGEYRGGHQYDEFRGGHQHDKYRGGHQHDEYRGGHQQYDEYRGGHQQYDEYRRGHHQHNKYRGGHDKWGADEIGQCVAATIKNLEKM